MLDLRVSITGGVHFDLVKRVLRDISRSGQAPEEIIQQVISCQRPKLNLGYALGLLILTVESAPSLPCRRANIFSIFCVFSKQLYNGPSDHSSIQISSNLDKMIADFGYGLPHVQGLHRA